MRTTLLATLAFVLTSVGVAAQQPDPELLDLLEANRYPVSISNGRLAGAGGDLLIEEGRSARFALLGEEHGIAEIPAFAAAWFRGLVPAGYRHLAVEVGPDAGLLLDSLARLGPEAIGRFQRERPPGFPFFILRSETGLLTAARAALPDEREAIWGIDYDILGDRYLFSALEAAAPDAGALAVVREIRAAGDAGLAEVVETGNPGRLLLWSAPDEPFDRLRTALRPPAGSRADRIIETMKETAAINRMFMSGRNWDSNHRRSQWMKRSMVRHLDAARANGETEPRVMVKLGANHLYRGLNQTRQYDIGAMLAQLAEAEGGRSFHLLVVGGPETFLSQFNPVALTYESQPAGMLSVVFPTNRLLLPDTWTLFDLRPLRPAIHDRRVEASQELFDVAFNFDAILVMTGSTPARPWFDPGAVLRR